MNNKDQNPLMSIGGLSRASGVPVETLRNWERRYGFPRPERRDSGHRRYPFEIVTRLRLIRRAIEIGYKPSFSVLSDESKLVTILDDSAKESRDHIHTIDDQVIIKELTEWHLAVERMDAGSLETGFERAWLQHGAVRFIARMMVPFFREVGNRWFQQTHTVAHEHFASEIAMSFLGQKWRPLSAGSGGPRVILANFEGELHCLGLHMAAVFLSLNDKEVVFLGPNTPRKDIIGASQQPGIVAVVIGMAASSDLAAAREHFTALKEELPSKVLVAVGGNHYLPTIPGVTRIKSFERFNEWSRALPQSPSSAFHDTG